MGGPRRDRDWTTPLEVVLRALLLSGVVVAATLAATATPVSAATAVPPLPSKAQLISDRHQFLQLAESGIAQAKKLWWDPSLNWYDEYRTSSWHQPLLMLWSAYQLFNALNGVALANPTAANIEAVREFANGAEEYWNPRVPQTGAYAYYPHYRDIHVRYYFDDNGWFGIAFLDAFRVTHDRRYLNDALRAYRFLKLGWDPDSGGFWWDTYHDHKTSEPLAAAILIGARLYGITHERSYLQAALTWLKWANSHSWNRDIGLYQRSATDTVVMSYVEGLAANANQQICEDTHIRGYCARAELIAHNSLPAFGVDLDWNPRYDAVDLYGLLNLYGGNHDETWYALAYHNAKRALQTQSTNGLFLSGWSGEPEGKDTSRQALGLDAGTLSVFAWLAATPVPSTLARPT